MSGTVSQFFRFCVVGTVGFVVDASVLYLAVYIADFDPYTGRLLSYLAAATTTWALNRTYTFTPSSRRILHREWAHYLIVNGIGGAANYGVYALSLACFAIVQQYLVIGVASGSIVGLVFNFTLSKWWIFRRSKSDDLLTTEFRGLNSGPRK